MVQANGVPGILLVVRMTVKQMPSLGIRIRQKTLKVLSKTNFKSYRSPQDLTISGNSLGGPTQDNSLK